MRHWRVLYVAWAVSILWLSLIPQPAPRVEPSLPWDKFLHFFAFAVLTLLGGKAFPASPTRRWSGALPNSLTALFLGCVVEVAQATLTSDRHADVGDLYADALGVVAANAIVHFC